MDLREYVRVVRARLWIIVAAVVITFGLALGVSLLQPRVYEAEANLLISEQSTASGLDVALTGFSVQPERGLQTQVRMLRMRPAFERTIRKLDLRMHPDQLFDITEIVPEGQTNVVTVRVRDEDPEQAARIANTLAEEYSLWVRDFTRSRIRAAATEVEKELEQLRAEMVSLGKAAGSNPSQSEALGLQIAAQDYAGLSEELRQLKVREQMEVGPVQVVNTAAVPEQPVAPTPVRNAALGLVAGVLLGITVAFVTESLDTSIKDTATVGELVSAPVLGIVPLQREDVSGGVVLNRNATAPVAEAFRGIRNSLDFINFEHKIKTLLITSAAPGEGKSTVAANLAEGLARAGKRVVIVSVDFHRPRSAAYLGTSENLGLSHVLSGQFGLETCLQSTGEGGPVVLAAGKVPPNPSELLGSERMGALIEQLEARADWVILDAPPVLAVADTTAVSKWTDGVLLVVRANKTTKDMVERAVQMLQGVGSRIIGSVLLGVTDGKSGAGSYSYSSYATRRSRGTGE